MQRYNHRASERARLQKWEQHRQNPQGPFYAAAFVPETTNGLGLENARLLVLADLYRRAAPDCQDRSGLGIWGEVSNAGRAEAQQLGCLISDLHQPPRLCVQVRDFSHLTRSLSCSQSLVCGRLLRTDGLSAGKLLPDFGADALRIALLYQGPLGKYTAFQPDILGAAFRFVQRLWRLAHMSEAAAADMPQAISELHAQVEQRLADQRPHTALAALMGFVNKLRCASPATIVELAGLVGPFAPFIAAELVERLAVPLLQDEQGGKRH